MISETARLLIAFAGTLLIVGFILRLSSMGEVSIVTFNLQNDLLIFGLSSIQAFLVAGLYCLIQGAINKV